MTEKQKQIVKLWKQGRSKLGIAKDVGVSRVYVYEYLIANNLWHTDKYQHIKRKKA